MFPNLNTQIRDAGRTASREASSAFAPRSLSGFAGWTMFELSASAHTVVRVRSGSPEVPVFEPLKRTGKSLSPSESFTRTIASDADTPNTSESL